MEIDRQHGSTFALNWSVMVLRELSKKASGGGVWFLLSCRERERGRERWAGVHQTVPGDAELADFNHLITWPIYAVACWD